MHPTAQENALRSPHHPAAESGPHGRRPDVQVSVEERMALLETVVTGAGSAESWLDARILLLASQGIPAEEIAEITGVGPVEVGSVIDGFLRNGMPG